MVAQMKIVNEATDTTVHTVKAPVRGKSANRQPAQSQHKRPEPQKLQRECWNCGQVHDVTNRETCPAYLFIYLFILILFNAVQDCIKGQWVINRGLSNDAVECPMGSLVIPMYRWYR